MVVAGAKSTAADDRLPLDSQPAACLDLATYYTPTRNTSGGALRAALSARIRAPHTRLTDSGLWSVIILADQHGNGLVQTLYRNEPRPAGHHTGSTGWEREHVWPVSYMTTSTPTACGGSPKWVQDAHNIFAEDPVYNSARSNRPYANCGPGQPYPAFGTAFANIACQFHGRAGWDVWDVWQDRRGDVARALLYMDVRYEGQPEGTCVEPDLVLTDDLDQVATGTNRMARICTLVRWHLADPVTLAEVRRNEVVCTSQGNRNPFVDNPQWVAGLWRQCATTVLLPSLSRHN